RRRQGEMAVPAEGDAFWLLLLHCLLDKRDVASRHRTRLRSLAPAGLESPLGPAVCAAAGSEFTPAAFVGAVQSGEWEALAEPRGPALVVAEILTRPLRIWSRYLVAQYHQLRGRLVVFDRYVYEALLPAQPPLLAVKRAYFWCLAHALPAPSAVIVLDVPGQV